MWTAILGILNGFLSVADRLLSAWMLNKERQAGRDEVALEVTEQALKDMEKAREIDSRPMPADRQRILDRL